MSRKNPSPSTDSPTPSSPEAPKRMKLLPLWKLLAMALGAHVLIVLVLSPTMGRVDEKSPQVMLQKARELRKEGKFEPALEAYQMVVNQKPPVPALFSDAERELHETRMESLDAKRREAEAAKQAEATTQAAQEKPKETTPGQPASPQPGEKPPAAPPVNLPQLPAIDGEL